MPDLSPPPEHVPLMKGIADLITASLRNIRKTLYVVLWCVLAVIGYLFILSPQSTFLGVITVLTWHHGFILRTALYIFLVTKWRVAYRLWVFARNYRKEQWRGILLSRIARDVAASGTLGVKQLRNLGLTWGAVDELRDLLFSAWIYIVDPRSLTAMPTARAPFVIQNDDNGREATVHPLVMALPVPERAEYILDVLRERLIGAPIQRRPLGAEKAEGMQAHTYVGKYVDGSRWKFTRKEAWDREKLPEQVVIVEAGDEETEGAEPFRG